MSKRTEINDSLKEAMKAKDELTVSTLRLVNAKIKDQDINARTTGNKDGVGDAEILSVLQGMIKQRQESADIYAKNARPELAERENAEIAIIQRYLPKQLDENEVKQAVDALVIELGAKDIKDMGKVMGALKTRYAGQMDMAKAGGTVKARLAG